MRKQSKFRRPLVWAGLVVAGSIVVNVLWLLLGTPQKGAKELYRICPELALAPREVDNHPYILVSLVDEHGPAKFRGLYKATGLYPLDSSTPIWTFPPSMPPSLAFVSAVRGLYTTADGRYLARLSESNTENGLSFYKEGALLKKYSLQSLQAVQTAGDNGCIKLWIGSVNLNEAAHQLEVRHYNGSRLKFDMYTGEEVPLTLADYLPDLLEWPASGLFTFVALGGAGWLYFRKKQN